MFGVVKPRQVEVPANLGALVSELTSLRTPEREQGTGHRAQSTENRAQGTGHREQAPTPSPATEPPPLATRHSPLATDLKEALYEQEKAVGAHRLSWIRAGAALREISERALYRWKNDTFEEYLQTRWGFSKRYGYDLITAAGVAENVRAVKHVLTVRAAIKLAKLPAEQQAECLTAAIAGAGTRSPTADYLAAAVAARLPARKKSAAAKKSKSKKSKPVRIRVDGGSLTVLVKAGGDLRAILQAALAQIEKESRIENRE